MQTFFDMLQYRRPMDSATEQSFIERFLSPLDIKVDEIGNVYKYIANADGSQSNILWSSHTDTVHDKEGFQTLDVNPHRVSLAAGSDSNCLGADCGTGVFIMTEMIKANKPGLYVFHRGEERGAKGSAHIAQDGTLLNGIDAAIAFDRYGTSSVITHQWHRCCSDEFGDSIIDQLPFLKLDQGGIFTDTANYDMIVPECTNLSVGYYNHHTSAEYQNLLYLKMFIENMLTLDTDKLIISRDPSAPAANKYGYDFLMDFDNEEHHYGGVFSFAPENDEEAENKPLKALAQLVRANPESVAGFLHAYGVSVNELLEYILADSRSPY